MSITFGAVNLPILNDPFFIKHRVTKKLQLKKNKQNFIGN